MVSLWHYHATPNSMLIVIHRAIINIWRPINTVYREALCMCDARSVQEDELRERPLKMAPQKEDPAAGMSEANMPDVAMWSVVPPTRPRDHKWYYISEMKPEEALLFKIFDSKQDGTAKRTPHTAFTTPNDHGSPRNSLEVRCLAFWEDQPAE